mgnify:CR=1 FL=1
MPLSYQLMRVNGDAMCLILFSYANHPDYRLILIANRDEFYERPTRPLASWHDAPDVYGGRDLKGNGTWLGVSRRGRIAAVTNYRDPAAQNPQALSRGLLTSRFLKGTDPPETYLNNLQNNGHRYNGFNLLIGDWQRLWYYSNRGNRIVALHPGLYGLSNRFIDTEWPKLVNGKKRLEKVLNRKKGWEIEELFGVLSDRAIAPDCQLPDTGVGLEWERLLSPLFITSPTYGTRSSTVLLIAESGEVTIEERSFVPNSPEGDSGKTRREQFSIQSSG